MRYEIHYTEEQIVQALHETADRGIKKEAAADNVQPPNLCAFVNSLPIPERERLVNMAFPSTDQPMQ